MSATRKRDAIVEAATDLFVTGGFASTSMDQVAARARVAKQTVYEHFGSKERLFTEIVLATIDRVGEPFFHRLAALPELDDSDDVHTWLVQLARELIAVVEEPRLLELRRLVIGTLGRFPDLGRAYAERGPGRTIEALAERFAPLADRGLLDIADVRLAAEQFNWLVLAAPINRATFDPQVRFDDAELDRRAAEAVRIFLAAFGSARR